MHDLSTAGCWSIFGGSCYVFSDFDVSVFLLNLLSVLFFGRLICLWVVSGTRCAYIAFLINDYQSIDSTELKTIAPLHRYLLYHLILRPLQLRRPLLLMPRHRSPLRHTRLLPLLRWTNITADLFLHLINPLLIIGVRLLPFFHIFVFLLLLFLMSLVAKFGGRIFVRLIHIVVLPAVTASVLI